jgi:hypothetical protein
MEEEIKNTTEMAKNTSESVNNFYSDIRPIVQPVAKCIGVSFIASSFLFREGSD